MFSVKLNLESQALSSLKSILGLGFGNLELAARTHLEAASLRIVIFEPSSLNPKPRVPKSRTSDLSGLEALLSAAGTTSQKRSQSRQDPEVATPLRALSV